MKKKILVSYIIMLFSLPLVAGCLSLQSGGSEAPPTKRQANSANFQETGLPQPSAVPILMYHSVGPEPNNDAVISRERFAEHMAFLHENGYNPITLDELTGFLAGSHKLPPRPVVLTFDDGYRDTYEIVYPILKQYGFKSVLFIPAAEVGNRLTWQELREMKAAGMQIASHSNSHRDLGDMPYAVQGEEIAKSKAVLDANLAQDTRDFCYPNGSHSQETIRLLQENGFRTAVTIEPGWVKLGDNPYTLRRVWMGNNVDLKHFEERITRQDYKML